MENRGYFDFETVNISNTKNKTYFWQLKINGSRYYGRYIEEFVKFIDEIDFPITLWAYNLTKYEANYIIPEFLKSDDQIHYFNINDDKPKKKIVYLHF